MSVQFSSYIRSLTNEELIDTLCYLSARKRTEELADKAGVTGADEVLVELKDQLVTVSGEMSKRKLHA